MTNNVKRIDYIDIAKAIGILFMVLEHAETINDLNYYISAFHVPIFFFISGFLYKGSNEAFVSFFKKKCRTLLLPYIIFGLAHYLFWLLRSDIKTVQPLVSLLIGDVMGFPIAGSLWFLTALFISEILYYLIDRFVDNNYFKSAIIILLSLFGSVASKYFPFALHYSFAQGCVGVGLMHLGRILRNSEKIFKSIFSLRWYVWLPVTAITLFLIRCNDVIHMFIASFGIVPLFWLNTVLSILIVFKFCIWLNEAAENSSFTKYLKHAGRNSIVYLCLNNITINISRRIIVAVGLASEGVLYSICLIALMLILLYIESVIITSTKLRVIIGRKI